MNILSKLLKSVQSQNTASLGTEIKLLNVQQFLSAYIFDSPSHAREL